MLQRNVDFIKTSSYAAISNPHPLLPLPNIPARNLAEPEISRQKHLDSGFLGKHAWRIIKHIPEVPFMGWLLDWIKTQAQSPGEPRAGVPTPSCPCGSC